MESNTNNNTGIIGIIALLLIIVLGAGTYLYYNKAEAPSQILIDEIEESALASSCGITVRTPEKGANVSFPITVTGNIDNTNAEAAGCSWVMFEGQAGKAELFYETKDGFSLPVDTKPIMVDNWMSTTSDFNVMLNFNNDMTQFPSGYNFKIVLTEDNPSGEPGDVVEIPVVLQ